MIRLLVLVLVFATQSNAETARVISGEHADFTRLVVELQQADDWTVGRTSVGYAFVTRNRTQPEYDLSAVWQRIPRTRLQALRVDPETGALQLSLACLCYVVPFEYQPGMIVLDIREGAPPAGSDFETPLVFESEGPYKPFLPSTAASAGYDWLHAAIPDRSSRVGLMFSPAAKTRLPDLGPLQEALLWQISRGAVDGLVDMKLPGATGALGVLEPEDPARARVSLGELPGLVIIDGRVDPDQRPDAELSCISDADLAVADWGMGRRPLDILAEARSGLYGEFDHLDTAAAMRSVRQHLYLGFGAEALQVANLLPQSHPKELALLTSMARLIEGDSDPTTPFARMLGCDGAAALWAALAHDRLPTAETANTDAMVRTFQGLPVHLRRHLGSRLADLVRERDPDAARMIRDAIERTPHVAPGTVAILDAKAELNSDMPGLARVHAEAAIAEGLPGLDGFVTLVEAHFQSLTPLGPEVAEALRSFARESDGGRDGPATDRALVLALALSGQTSEALATAHPDTKVSAEVWRVLSERASDRDLLINAVFPSGSAIPTVDPEVSERIARRLLGLGFPDAALAWLGVVAVSDREDRRMLAATAELARGDARQALTLATGLVTEEAELLQAAAQASLGAYEAAQLGLQLSGRMQEAARIAAWQSDWVALDAIGAEPWATMADHAAPVPPGDDGALARGESALESSAATRSAIAALLAAVPPGDR